VGDVVAVGDYQGNIDFGGPPLPAPTGYSAGYVVKFDPLGTLLWSKGWTATGGVNAAVVTTDASGHVLVGGGGAGSVDFGGGPITGYNLSDAFLVELDGSGKHVFSRFLTPATSHAYDQSTISGLAASHDGGILVGGSFEGTVDFGGGVTLATSDTYGTTAAFVAKLDPQGQGQWARQFGSAAQVTAVREARSGAVVVCGFFRGSADLGAGPMQSSGSPSGSPDMLLASYDPTGTLLWAKQFPAGIGWAEFWDLAVDGAGDILVTGDFMGPSLDLGSGPQPFAGGDGNGFVAKLDSSGALLWSHIYGWPGDATDAYGSSVSGRGITVAASGDVVAMGVFMGPVDFGDGLGTSAYDSYNVYLMDFAPDGSRRWARQLPLPNYSTYVWTAFALDPTDHPLVTAWFAPTLDWGSDVLTVPDPFPVQDAFVAKLEP
jgi:hypothetical protein